MKKKIRDLWCEALRSKKYKKGRLVMKDTNEEFCPLGILCELHRKAQKNGKKWRKTSFEYYKYLGYSTDLPDEVCKWAGLKDSIPMLSDESIWYLNDSLGLSFEEIADLIEKHL